MKLYLWLVLFLAQYAATASAQIAVDPMLPDYKPKSGVAGKIDTVGSDTMNNLAQLWTEEFKRFYPGVSSAIDAKGSSNAIPALVNGSATFGPMSRDAKKSEIQAFNEKFGYDPVLLPTSIDMVAVYVNRNNPLEGLSFPEIDAIFSSTRKGGARAQAKTWGQLGATGELKDKKYECYGRNAASGTYGFFKEKVLKDGDFGDWVTENAGSSAVVQSVGANLAGIGYSGIGYRTPNVKPLKLAVERGGELVAAEPENAYNGKYPLARPLYLAINYDKRKPLDPLRAEFVRYILSKQGQTQVAKDGYLPLDAETALEVLAMVGLK
ncbi:MAG: phosphate ABC transporter substrate-binding protein PstS family protein [Pirellulaceae bacterium]|nr:phosphate ABC transporter substrate-binding protein PstS family protein [Pirellulaceae bacterium]